MTECYVTMCTLTAVDTEKFKEDPGQPEKPICEYHKAGIMAGDGEKAAKLHQKALDLSQKDGEKE